MRINIVPIEIKNKSLIDFVIANLKSAFNADVNQYDLDIELNKFYDESRKQYYSTQILSELVPLSKKIEGHVLLLVDVDLFVPVFTYLFGEAQLNGKLSIVSTFRLYEEFYTGRTNEKLLFERVIKEVIHELGHNFGLIHCEDWNCVMHSSAGIEEVDIKGKYLLQ